MASPGLKEEPLFSSPTSRALFSSWAAGGDRGLADAMAPAVTVTRPVKLVTLKVQDAQRRVVTRTMRRTDKLKGLMDYYYEMVCSAGAGAGGTRGAGHYFVFDGKRLKPDQTPEELGMKSGDKIDFFGDLKPAVIKPGDVEEVDRKPVIIKPAVHVTLKLKVQDTEGRTVKRTVRITQKLQEVMDAYYDSVPDVTIGTGKFLYYGRQLKGGQTPAELKMEDEDAEEIEIDFFGDMLGGGGVGAATAAEQPPPVPA